MVSFKDIVYINCPNACVDKINVLKCCLRLVSDELTQMSDDGWRMKVNVQPSTLTSSENI